MLPPAVVDTARNGVRVAIGERRELLRHEIADLKEQYGMRGTLHGTPYLQAVTSALGEPADTLARMQQEAVEQVAAEVEFAILEATQTQPAGAQTAMFSFYPPIGVVQTGAGATASVQQTLGATDRETILHALQAVEQAIAPATELAPTDRTQITAVVVALRDELAKPQPNLLRLRSGLVGIATTIQTRGAAAAAYQLVKGALALLGVHLT